MKWYEYRNKLINLEKFETIAKYDDSDEGKWYLISFEIMNNSNRFVFDTEQERDAEFEKIKTILGIRDHTSRCC